MSREVLSRRTGYAGDRQQNERRVFLSHSSKDKEEVRKLRKALADRDVAAWEDVLELRLGDSLDGLRDVIKKANGFVQGRLVASAHDAGPGSTSRPRAQRPRSRRLDDHARSFAPS